MLAGELGHDVVGVYPGPLVIARLTDGEMLHVHAHDVVIATGAAELHPVCDGNMLRGIFTTGAAERLTNAGVDLGVVATVDLEQLRTHRRRRRARHGGGHQRRRFDAVPLTGRHVAAHVTTRPVGPNGQ